MGNLFQVFDKAHQSKMLFKVLLVCFVATAAAAPSDVAVGYDLDDHEHTQKGEAGTAVTGSYSFTGADGVEHTVTYIADDKGYRVVGDAKIESQPRPTTARPAPAPTAAPTRAPVAKAPAAAVQYVQVAQVPQQYSTAQVYSGGFCQYQAVGVSRSGEQEVVGQDGARYVLKKVQ